MTDAPTTHDPVEMAMEAEASGAPPPSAARRLIEKQEKLVGWQIASERAGFALKVLTGLAGVAVAVGLGVMMWQAANDRSIVVRAFHAPPSYAARGLDGEVLAGRFMDRLRTVQRATADGSLVSARRLAEDAAGLKVEILRTGLSLADLQQLLAGWLGNRTVITGALTEDGASQVTLEARIGAGASVRVSGPPEQLDAMTTELAERAFAALIPNQFSLYLRQTGRLDEGLAAARAHALRGLAGRARNPNFESSGVNLWGQAEGDYRRARELVARAVEEGPAGRVFRRALVRMEFRLGQEAAALSGARTVLSMKPSKSHDPFDARGQAWILGDGRYFAAYLTGDFTAAAVEAPLSGDLGDAAAFMHDGRAWAALALDAEEGRRSAPDFARAALRRAVNERDWPAALVALDAYDRAVAAWLAEPAGADLPPRAASKVAQAQMASQETWIIGPLRAVTLAHGGRLPEAQAIAARLPADCAPCLRARATVAEAAGDRAGADRWFAAALAVSGDSPLTETAWAEALLARGDADGAIAKLTSAAAKGPRYADALELWGEALLAKGNARGADAKFAAAAKLAPRWDRLNAMWREARAKLGRTT